MAVWYGSDGDFLDMAGGVFAVWGRYLVNSVNLFN